MTLDLVLPHTDLISNSDHLLIRDFLATKIEISEAKRPEVVCCTQTDIPTNLCKVMCRSVFELPWDKQPRGAMSELRIQVNMK